MCHQEQQRGENTGRVTRIPLAPRRDVTGDGLLSGGGMLCQLQWAERVPEMARSQGRGGTRERLSALSIWTFS